MTPGTTSNQHAIELVVNDKPRAVTVESRTTLADCLRSQLGLTGTHLGCEHGVCGACTVLVDGRTARGCLMLAAQADGCRITTVEGLSGDGELAPLQQAFWNCHGLQCGYCTPGILMTLTELLADDPRADENAIRLALSGHLCRCTGYQNIVAAALAAVECLRGNA
ncbi:MAG: (2Fe-2S)-binding protein [Betaproteobacteria bacterium]